MSTELNPADLDQEAVAQAEETLASWLQTEYPSMDLTQGRVLRDLLIRPAAIFHVMNQTDVNRLRQSMSLLAIEQDPTLADDTIVDGIMSNYGIARDPGSKAAGQAVIVIPNLLTTYVAPGTVFAYGSLNFVTAGPFVGVTTVDAVIDPAVQRLITLRRDRTYMFVVDVVAQGTGSEYWVRKDTAFDSVSPTPTGLVTAYAYADFSAGTDAQTNEDLVNEVKNGVAAKVFSGRAQIEALLLKTLPAIAAISIIGFGDAEMVRDRHNIFAISTGGKADLYVRTQAVPQTVRLVKTAVLVDLPTKTWQVTLARDDAPGFYDIDSILPTDAPEGTGSLEIGSETRGLDLSAPNDEFVPDIDSLTEGGFSRYQTDVVRFVDPDTDGSVAAKDYAVYVRYMPNLVALQDLAVSRDNRNPQADYLVRAPVPGFCTMNITVRHLPSVEAPDGDDIKLAVADRVNRLGFGLGKVSASVVFDAIYDIIGHGPSVMAVSPLDMFCRIVKPAGGVIDLRSANELVAPFLPAEGVTSRTVAFYLDPDDVDVVVEQVDSLPV